MTEAKKGQDESPHRLTPGTETPLEPVEGPRRDQLQQMYRDMLLIRRFEEAAARHYARGKIGGFCHLYIGQEAVAVGVLHALQDRDYVVSTYRDHGHALARGLDPRALMAELFGKRSGIAGGKGGSMHFFDKTKRFMGGHGIVGGHVALATGNAWAAKYRNEGAVTVCFFGEGAANIGTFHESLNLAGIWKLPIVYICENNHYSMGTPEYRSLSVKDVSIRACAYDMTRDSFVGDSVLKVEESLRPHIEKARRGEGPSLLEISTYRFRGHSMSDPARYRTREELETYKARDPLDRARRVLELSGVAEKDLARIEAEVKGIVEDAVSFAEKAEEPPPTALWSDVLV